VEAAEAGRTAPFCDAGHRAPGYDAAITNRRGRNVKKIVVFDGSGRKRHTQGAALQFLRNLQALGDVEYEIVALRDHRIETCRGCQACFDSGEERCPLHDDRDVLIAKMEAADGVVWATPNYSFQVSGTMKTFLDRLGFVFHRPRFFGKTWTSIVCQGIYGGGRIVKYLDFVGGGLGFNAVKGSCLTTRVPITAEARRKIDRTLAGHARRFHQRLARPAFAAPTLFKLMIFRMGRTSMKISRDPASRDYAHYRDKGWFESDYWYPVPLSVVKKAAGRLFDLVAGGMASRA
jgi:multimeric flavodoxin WrbA